METNKTLVDLDRECRDLVAQISAGSEDVSPEALATLEAVEVALCQKVDNYSFVIDLLESEAELWKKRESQCNSARKSFQRSQERLKERMKYVLMGQPDKSLQGEMARFFLAKAAPKVEINDAELPDSYKTVKIQTVPDRDKIDADLKAGKIVPGAVMVENFSLREGRPKK